MLNSQMVLKKLSACLVFSSTSCGAYTLKSADIDKQLPKKTKGIAVPAAEGISVGLSWGMPHWDENDWVFRPKALIWDDENIKLHPKIHG